MGNFAKELDLSWAETSLESPESLSRNWGKNFGFDYYYPLVSRSSRIKDILALVKKVAKSNASILIQGETGTGKELIAGLIQFISLRHNKPYVKVNCAALPESLLESELFGHEKGSFTGAHQTRIGKFEQAHEGTLFLDEIGDMNLFTQAKILRVLQDQDFTRVGGTKTIHVDVRIMAATNKDLWDEIEKGNFRDDLLYRLNVVTINVPPLRERQEDIPLIAEFFRRKFSSELRKNTRGFTEETMRLLKNHRWSGNIRELKNIIERAVLMTDEGKMVGRDELAFSGKDYFAAGGGDRRKSQTTRTELTTLKLDDLERESILKALEVSKWIQKDAANLLGISARSLNYKIQYHKITHPSWKKNI
jgi:transcriptional regulator with GAF, ATPase, and Fis domain